MGKLYIHYGSKKFDKKRVTCKRPSHLGSKPNYGLWASPLDTNWGWKDWCDNEGYMECTEENSFMFSLTSTAKILNIFTEDDIMPYISRSEQWAVLSDWRTHIYGSAPKTSVIDTIDWDKIVSDGYDAVELYNSIDLHYTVFNSWDCDSIVILNPDIVVERK